ncbi:uncharacterized protein [Typha angustifolia]|uniref:uncharacterized protein isoform X3 n=1 Tax=Typha angustifolia TaxID=59011 RepID=UPI003C2D2186
MVSAMAWSVERVGARLQRMAFSGSSASVIMAGLSSSSTITLGSSHASSQTVPLTRPATMIPCLQELPFHQFLTPCLWSFCGRGTCIKTSDFEHRCECGEGYSNLLNISTLPCFKKCRITADCAVLGFTLSNSSSPTASPNFFEHNGRGLVQGSWKIGTELVHFFASFNSHNKLSVVLQLGNVSSSMDKLLKASFGGYSSIGSIIPSLACNFDSRIAHCTRKKSNSTEVQYSFSIFYSCSIC